MESLAEFWVSGCFSVLQPTRKQAPQRGVKSAKTFYSKNYFSSILTIFISTRIDVI